MYPCTTRRRDPNRRSGGFTLVELLVVIGIIALLIGILLPTLGKAREKANEVKCSSNLRQIGIGLQFYINDTGYYPGSIGYGHGGSLGQVAIWQTRIRKAMRMQNNQIFNCPTRDSSIYMTDRYVTNGNAAQAADAGYGYIYDPAHNKTELLLRTGVLGYPPSCYGYNDWGIFQSGPAPANISDGLGKGLGGDVDRPGDTDPNSAFHEIKASRIKKPADLIAVTEKVQVDGGYNYNADPTDPTQYPGDVHSHGAGGGTNNAGNVLPAGNKAGGSNVLFADGHVVWYSQADLVNVNSTKNPASPSDTGGRWVAMRRLWNNDNMAYEAFTPP